MFRLFIFVVPYVFCRISAYDGEESAVVIYYLLLLCFQQCGCRCCCTYGIFRCTIGSLWNQPCFLRHVIDKSLKEHYLDLCHLV